MNGIIKYVDYKLRYGYITVPNYGDFRFNASNIPDGYAPKKGDNVAFVPTRNNTVMGGIAKTDAPASVVKTPAVSLTIIHFDERRYEWMKWQAGKWSPLNVCQGMPRVGIHTSSVNGKVLAVITPAMWRGDEEEE